MTFSAKHQLLLLLFMMFVGVAAYSNTFNVPFLFDDYLNIVENPFIKLDTFDYSSLMEAGSISPHPHRPVAYISFALNHLIHKNTLAGYHVVNIAIHLITGLLLFFFVKTTLQLPSQKTIGPDKAVLVAFFGAFLWLVHPVQTQAVTYIVQRMTSLSAMFYILSLVLYQRGRLAGTLKAAWTWFVFAFLSGVMALGSKEIAATLPFFILLYEWYFFQDLSRQGLRRLLPYFCAIIFFAVLVAFFYLGASPVEVVLSGYDQRDFTPGQRLLTQGRVIAYYLSLLFFPHPSRLNLDHHILVSSSLITPLSTLISLVGIFGLFATACYQARSNRLLSFAIIWFLGNLLIESSVIGLELAFEHRLYLPSMFVCLIAVVFLLRKGETYQLRLVSLGVLIVLFAFWTHSRNTVWSDELTLWTDVIQKSPAKGRGYNAVGMYFYENQKPDIAIPYFQQSLALDPQQASVRNNLGLSLLGQGKVDMAIVEFQQAVRIQPQNGMYHVNLGIAYWQKGMTRAGQYEMQLGKELRRRDAEKIRNKTQ